MPRTRGQQQVVEQSQNYTDEQVSRKIPSWVADGHELSVELSPGTTKVPHRLGRPLSGWMIQRFLYSGTAPTLCELTSDKTTITFVHTGPKVLKLKLWVW